MNLSFSSRSVKNCFISLGRFVNLWGQVWSFDFNKIRQFLFTTLAKNIGFKPAQLVFAMIFGVEGQFPSDLYRFFKVMGMLHIVSASGFNVSLVVRLFDSVLGEGIGHRFKAYLLTVLVIAYFLLSSRGVSLIRASLMALLSLWLRLLFLRQSNPRNNLYMVSLFLLVLNLDFVTSVSFQLSVLATVAILWVYPAISSNSGRGSGYSSQVDLADFFNLSSQFKNLFSAGCVYLEETFYISLAVNLVVLPLTIYHFQELSLLSLPCNLLLLWLVPLVTMTGLIWLGLNLIFSSFGWWSFSQISSFLLWLPTQLLLSAAQFLGDWDWSVIKMPKISFSLVLLWWFGLWLVLKIKKWRRR